MGEGQNETFMAECLPMRQLLLLRHAKSAWNDSTIPDRDRPLNPRGRRSAGMIRRAMRDLGLTPDLVLVSTAKRTMETLEALEPWDDTPLVEPLEALYLADMPQLLTVLRDVAETVRSVLLIGHNPGVHDLALALAETRSLHTPSDALRALTAGYPTGALAEFVIAGQWGQLGAGGGRLVRFVTPRTLEAAG